MTRLLLLMLGVAQRFPNCWAGCSCCSCCLLLVIVEKSSGGLTQRAVDTPRTWCLEGESIGGVGGWRWWRGSWSLVMLWPRVGQGLWLHAVIWYRHPLTINREQAPPDSLLNVRANVLVAQISAENNSSSEMKWASASHNRSWQGQYYWRVSVVLSSRPGQNFTLKKFLKLYKGWNFGNLENPSGENVEVTQRNLWFCPVIIADADCFKTKTENRGGGWLWLRVTFNRFITWFWNPAKPRLIFYTF